MARFKLRFPIWFFYGVLLIFLAILLAKPVNLTNQDIGRHIANGRSVLAEEWSVLSQNFYSYTAPERTFINHHWLFGVLAFLNQRALGFSGLHLTHIFILIAAGWLLLKMMHAKAGPAITVILGLAAMMFLGLRAEIRPESIGFLFLAHTLWQLDKVIRNQRLPIALCLILIMQQIIWVNSHISFIFSIFFSILLFICSHFFHSPQLNSSVKRKLLLLSTGLGLSSLLNPNLLAGALQPLTIFSDYGYSVYENQNLWFLWQLVNNFTLIPYLLAAGLTAIIIIKYWSQFNLYELITTLFGLTLGFLALRHIAIYTLLTFPNLAKGLSLYRQDRKHFWSAINVSSKHKLLFSAQLYLIFIPLILSGIILPPLALSSKQLGLLSNQTRAAEFIKKQHLPRPIFNNYDIGSYLIYHCPEIKVFVDNRPEAYGKDFFEKKYKPMQQHPDIWKQQLDEYNFQTVIFGITDITDWALQFVEFINQDPEWEQVFADRFIHIWVRQPSEN